MQVCRDCGQPARGRILLGGGDVCRVCFDQLTLVDPAGAAGAAAAAAGAGAPAAGPAGGAAAGRWRHAGRQRRRRQASRRQLAARDGPARAACASQGAPHCEVKQNSSIYAHTVGARCQHKSLASGCTADQQFAALSLICPTPPPGAAHEPAIFDVCVASSCKAWTQFYTLSHRCCAWTSRTRRRWRWAPT